MIVLEVKSDKPNPRITAKQARKLQKFVLRRDKIFARKVVECMDNMDETRLKVEAALEGGDGHRYRQALAEHAYWREKLIEIMKWPNAVKLPEVEITRWKDGTSWAT